MEPAKPPEPPAAQEPRAPPEQHAPQEPRASREPHAPQEPRAPREQHAPQEPAPVRDRGGALERVLGWIVPERNPEGAVYGMITIGALLAAESGLRDGYPDTVASLSIAVLLYWFAHSYADVLGLRLSKQRLISWGELRHTFVQDWAIVRGAGAPLLVLLAGWALGASQGTAVAAGTWTAVVGLVVFELAAGMRSRAKPVELTLEVLVGATMGLAILALRALLH